MKLGEKIHHFTIPPYPKGITLEGNYTILQPLSLMNHSEDLFKANALDINGENWTYLPYGPFASKNEYFLWIKNFEHKEDPFFFAIINKQSTKAIGVASFLRVKPSCGSIEVGHIHYSPQLQKTTEATEAMYLMMKWVFENGYRRYEWKCNALNRQSRNAAQRLGFSYEGIFRQATINKGRNRDTAWFAIIDKEWKDIQKCFVTYLSKDNLDAYKKPILSLSSLTRPFLHKTDDL